MFLVNKKEITGNDVYFLESWEDKLLINNNYKGLLVLDRELKFVQDIQIDSEIIIDKCIKNDGELLLICTDNKKILYINLKSYEFKTILMKEYSDWSFSDMFYWNKKTVILLAYNGRNVQVDLEKNTIKEIEPIENALYNYQYNMLKNMQISKIFVKNERAIRELPNDDLELIEYSEEAIHTLGTFPERKFHDFEINDIYIALIGETEVFVINLKNNNCHKIYPQNGYIYMRGRFWILDNDIHFAVISACQSDGYKTIIENYLLEK